MPTITLPGENGQSFSTIMGRPVFVTQACQTLGTVGDILLCDLKSYFAPYKAGGVRGDISMHLWFDQGLQAFRWTFRVGGQPWLSTYITPKNGTNYLSPFVSLATR
jgi:HK97 family phage major capsid protein